MPESNILSLVCKIMECERDLRTLWQGYQGPGDFSRCSREEAVQKIDALQRLLTSIKTKLKEPV